MEYDDFDITDAIMESIRDIKNADKMLMLNPIKANQAEKTYNQIVKLFTECEAEYNINIRKSSLLEKDIIIEVKTDYIDINDKCFLIFKDIVQDVNAMFFSAVDRGKLHISFTISDVFSLLDVAVDSEQSNS